MATGPYAGHPFRVERQPFTGLLFDELDSGRWPTVYITGPSQSSKTLSGFVIPTLRDAVELRQDVVLGIPEADMATDKWDKDFLPTLAASPALRPLIPAVGPGSRGGRVRDRITLTSGVDLKIITCGGQDTAKAGFTASRIRVTEAAGWSKASERSVEANPLRQLIARMRSFRRHERSLIVEGTTTIEDELPWSARGSDDDDTVVSTRSRIVSQCPHCEAWVSPEREHLVGWDGAESEQQAADQACFICPSCAVILSEAERREMNRGAKLLHHGQTIDKHGRISGDLPPTSTLWFRWTAFNNLLLDAADTAIDEWKAAQIEEGTVDGENAERELCQFCHAVPFKSQLAAYEPLAASAVRKRRETFGRNELPPDVTHLTMGVDLGDWTAWWLVIAFRADGTLLVPAYGAFDVKRNQGDDLEKRIAQSLREFRNEVGDVGIAGRMFDRILVDCGYRPDDVATFVRSTGPPFETRWSAARGRGLSTNHGGYEHPRKASKDKPRVGLQWYGQINFKRKIPEYTFNADFWKLYVQERLRVKQGAPGSLVLHRADGKNEHAKLSRHLVSEQLEPRWDEKKGLVKVWVKKGQNHWLDCAAMACVAGNMAGFVLPSQVPEPSTTSEDEGQVGARPPDVFSKETQKTEPKAWYERMQGAS